MSLWLAILAALKAFASASASLLDLLRARQERAAGRAEAERERLVAQAEADRTTEEERARAAEEVADDPADRDVVWRMRDGAY